MHERAMGSGGEGQDGGAVGLIGWMGAWGGGAKGTWDRYKNRVGRGERKQVPGVQFVPDEMLGLFCQERYFK